MRLWRAWMGVVAAAAMAQTPPDGYSELPQGKGWYRGAPAQFRIWEGQALAEGDILLDRVEPPAGKESGRAAAVRSGDRFRWTDRVIPYEIDPAMPAQQRVTDAIEEWNTRTVIRLKPREGEANYVRFTRVPSGCSSFLGMIGGAQPINLSDLCTRGNTVHEIGHAVGLLHEQSRNDRANFVTVLYENILRTQWSDFDRRATTTDDAGPYDYGSIMHYPQLAFNSTPRNAIQSVPAGIPIGQRAGLSAAEIQAVARMHGEPVREVVIDTFPSGLPIVVDGESFRAPRAFPWNEGEVHTVAAQDRITASANAEYRFARWSGGGTAEHSLTVTVGTTVHVANYALYFRLRTGVSPEGAGSVEVSPPSEDGYYPAGTLLRIRATPAEGFQFFRWASGANTALNANEQGDGSNPVELSIRNDAMNYVANFLNRDFTIIGANRPGTLLSVDGQGLFAPAHRDWAPGSAHSISVDAVRTIADAGTRHVFRGWSNGGERQQSITVAGPETISADVGRQFRVDRQVFATRLVSTPPPTPQNLALSPGGDGWYDEGTVLEIRAVEPDGLPFSNWVLDVGGRANPQTIIVDRHTLLGANFIGAPALNELSAVNDASQQPLELAPGMRFTLYTPGIGGDAVVEPQPDGGAYPTEVSGVAVLIGGARVGIARLAKGAVTAIAPASLPAGKAIALAVETGGQRRTLMVPTQSAAPGIYTPDGSGRGTAAASAGGVARILATGVVDGLAVSVEVAGFPAEVLSVQPEQPGQVSIEFRIPAEAPAGAAVPVILMAGGVRSQVTATIGVQ